MSCNTCSWNKRLFFNLNVVLVLDLYLSRDVADRKMWVGARVGGLGNMPGWWFTIESTTTRHFVQQFKTAIEDALKAKPAVRAIMRARATKQRFPVSQWVEDLEKLQSSAIEISHKQAAKERRPTLISPSTPAILETPNLLNVLQSRLAKPSLRPRPAEASLRLRPTLVQAPSQVGGLSSIVEGRLLAGPSPGLGSKLGPGSKRKGSQPPLLRNISGPITRIDFAPGAKRSEGESSINVRRPLVIRAPTAPSLSLGQNGNKRDANETFNRPTMERSLSGPVPQLRLSDRKAIKLLGMQLPESRTSSSNASKPSPSSSEDNSTQPSSAISSPTTPRFFTPPSTPSPSSRQHFSVQTHTSAATSVSAATPVNATDFNIIHSPHAVDHFPSLGPHYFPHGSVAVLSASEIKGENPDNILQNVTPFFSDPEKEYETVFKQKLKKLSGKNSEDQLCIEEYLLKSEKSWFGKLRAAELSKTSKGNVPEQPHTANVQEIAKDGGFGLGNNHKPPSGLKRIMRKKVGDWPVYSFLLAFVSSSCPADDDNLAYFEFV